MTPPLARTCLRYLFGSTPLGDMGRARDSINPFHYLSSMLLPVDVHLPPCICLILIGISLSSVTTSRILMLQRIASVPPPRLFLPSITHPRSLFTLHAILEVGNDQKTRRGREVTEPISSLFMISILMVMSRRPGRAFSCLVVPRSLVLVVPFFLVLAVLVLVVVLHLSISPLAVCCVSRKCEFGLIPACACTIIRMESRSCFLVCFFFPSSLHDSYPSPLVCLYTFFPFEPS